MNIDQHKIGIGRLRPWVFHVKIGQNIPHMYCTDLLKKYKKYCKVGTKIGHSSETLSARLVPQALGVGSNIGAFITLPIIINTIFFGVTQNIAPDVISAKMEVGALVSHSLYLP